MKGDGVELSRGVGLACGALIVTCHQRSEISGRWSRGGWVAGELPGLPSSWAPPVWQETDPPLQQALAQRICPTDPLQGLGPLDPEAAELLRASISHGVLLGVPRGRSGASVLWLGFDREPARERLEGVAQMIEALSTHEECRYRNFFERIPATFIAAGLDGIIRDCNTGVSIFGYEPGELIGKPTATFFAPGERERFRSALLKQAQVEQHEAAFRHRSGKSLTGALMAAVVFDEEEQPVELIAIGRDLRPARELDHHRRMEAVGRMISGVAHELNNPLQTVLGNAEMLAEMKLPGFARRRAQGVLSGARRCQEVVDGLLRMKLQRRELVQRVDLEEIVRRVVAAAQLEFPAQPVRLEVSLQAIPAIEGDAADLEQALSHILRNAFQAVAGQPEPRIALTSEVSGEMVELMIQDNGTGMPPEVLSRAFEPFFTTREIGAGKGLGLSIALCIIHEHGGILDLRSESGLTRALVSLPIPRSKA